MFVLGFGVSFADEEILRNGDGAMPENFEVEEGIAARFLPKSSFELIRVSINLVEPFNPFNLHIWPDDGAGLPDTAVELTDPVLVEPDAGFVQVVFSSHPRLDEETVYVGLMPEDDPFVIAADESINCRFPNLYLDDGEWKVYEPGDFSIKLVIDRADEDRTTFFEDATEDVGLEGWGGRQAWGDIDNDGFEDLCTSGLKLYLNVDGESFVDITEQAGLSEILANGCLFADIDNDGYLDIYAQNGSLEDYDRILMNNGDGTFRDATLDMIEEEDLDYNPTEGAAFGDVNNDGWIDLYLANYELPAETEEDLGQGTQDKLYYNDGGKRFVERAKVVGMDEGKYPKCGRGANFADFDNDGDMDLFVSNYRLDQNFLYVNQGDNTFDELASEYDVQGNPVRGYYGHTIGSVFADFDNDGDLDLFSANLAHPRFIEFSDMSMMFENTGPPDYTFDEITCDTGIFFEETHSHPTAADIDNDGDLDLFVTSVYGGRYSYMFVQTEPWKFVDYTYEAGTIEENGWGATFCDFNNDGRVDLLSRRLYRNTSAEGHWLEVELVGTKSNRAAIGAVVFVEAGGLNLMRVVTSGNGTGCGDSMILHFGLGDSDVVDEIRALFPSGIVRTLEGVDADQRITIRETEEKESGGGDEGCGCNMSYDRSPTRAHDFSGLALLLVLTLLLTSRRRRGI